MQDFIKCYNPENTEKRRETWHPENYPEGRWRNDMELESDDHEYRFRVFMRKNENFEENFSIGLNLLGKDGSDICLLRCDGPHGSHIDLPDDASDHFRYHIHMASAEPLERGTQPEVRAKETIEYSSFDDALAYFIRRYNIYEGIKIFPRIAALIQGQKLLMEP